MYPNICLAGMCSFSKYVKATGSLILLNPSFFNSSKSASLIAPAASASLFHVCSSHEKLMPLSRLRALLNANARKGWPFGLLFALAQPVIVNNNIDKKLKNCLKRIFLFNSTIINKALKFNYNSR